MSTAAMSGWLRKRPRFVGHWPERYVSLGVDGKLVIYSHDPSKVDSSQLLVALMAVHIPKLVTVDGPTETMVRTKRNGPKREQVFAIKVSFKNRVLFTFGASTAEIALKWKTAIEDASKMTVAPEDMVQNSPSLDLENQSPSSRPSGTRDSMLPEGWRGADDNWHVVEEKDGFQVEGEKQSSQSFPVLRARATVESPPEEIFKIIMDDAARPSWDEGALSSKVLKDLGDQSAIVYLQTKEFWVGPAIYSGPRDLVMLRYWRKDANAGDYSITWQSVEDLKLAPPADGFTRGKVFYLGITISPQPGNQSLIRISCHADPGGTMSYMPSNVLQKWLAPFVTRILGIQKALNSKRHDTTLEEDHADEDDTDTAEVSTSAKAVLPKLGSFSAAEVNTLKLGSWNHSEWMETPSDEPFNVRGKTYLKDKVKIRTGRHMFHIIAADLNRTKKPVPHCAARSDSPLRKIQEAYPDRQVLVLQFIMPGPPFYILAVYAVSKPGVCEEDTPFSRLWNNFVEGTDEYRNTVFKMIPRVTKGAYVVKKTVGEVPAVLGQKIKLNYYTGPNYVEVDVDLNTSAVAGSILSIFKGYATTLTADLSILLEGHSEDELPEEILFSFRMVKPVLANAIVLGDDPNPVETQRLIDLAEKARIGEVQADH